MGIIFKVVFFANADANADANANICLGILYTNDIELLILFVYSITVIVGMLHLFQTLLQI